MLQKTFKLSALAGAIIATSPTYAANSKLEEIIVTADRTEKPLRQTLSATTLMTSLDIERIQPADLPDLLARIPGVDIRHNGGRGSQSSVYIRGTNSDHILVLLDGIRIGSASLGSTSLEHIDPRMIERIELVRGPKSSLYGSDAIGGVLQIFTKRGSKELEPTLRVGAGKFDTYSASASISGSADKTGFSLGASHYETDGIDHLSNDEGINSDDDLYRKSTVTANINHQFDNKVAVALSHYYSDGKNQLDDRYPSPGLAGDLYTEFTTSATALNIWLPISNNISLSTVAGFSKDESHNQDVLGITFGYPSEFNTERSSLNTQLDINVTEGHTVIVGAEYHNDELSGSANYVEDSRDNVAVYAQYEAQLGDHTLIGSLRNDDNEQFGQEDTGSLAWAWQFSPDIRFGLSYGKAFKAPSFNDLYWPEAGNPDLSPESSDSYEAELRGEMAQGYWTVNLYHTDIDDLIEWAPIAPGSWTWIPSNVASAEIDGAEVAVFTTIGHWEINANASYTDARNSDTDKLLIGRAQRAMNIDVDRNFNRWSVGASFRAKSHRFGDTSNIDRTAGFGTLDLRSRVKLPNDLQLEVSVNNLLDQEDRTISRYNSEGLSYMLTLSWLP